MDRYHDINNDIPDKILAKAIDDMGVGCFIVVYELPVTNEGQHNVESITMHKFVRNISTMISKENLFNLHMRYLSTDERAIARKALYLEVPK